MHDIDHTASAPTSVPPAPGPPPGPDRPRHRPIQIAPDTFVIQDTVGEGVAPTAVHMNSMLIRGSEPVVVDTGVPGNRDRYLEDLFGLVEPTDVRWVFLSHDDVDHYGNVDAVMDLCPNATLLTSWFLTERLVGELHVPPTRWRWIGDGESFDAGDRVLSAIRPPLYDSPTTRGLFDARSGVYWASDCFATPVARGTAFVEDLDPVEWRDGFVAFNTWNSPWVSLVDRSRFLTECRRVTDLPLTAIAGTHGPTIEASNLAMAFELLRRLPDDAAPPQPGQELLDQIVAAMTAAAPPPGVSPG
jgi:flavorubredoxin